MIKIWLVSLFAVLCWGQVSTVTSIANPRPGGGWITDAAVVFSKAEKKQIDAELEQIHRDTQAEVALVTVRSIGAESPKAFATKLFNHWGIGRKGVDDGLLILLVTDQRRIEMETGYGLEGTLPDVVLFRLQQDYIVPAMKAGRGGPGFLKAIQEIHKRIVAAPAQLPAGGEFKIKLRQWGAVRQNIAPKTVAIGIGSLVLFSVLFLWVFISVAGAFRLKDPLACYRGLSAQPNTGILWSIGCLFGFIGTAIFLDTVFLAALLIFWVCVLAFGWISRQSFLNRYRKMPRICSACGEKMEMKNDVAEDEFQSKEEKLEEKIGSIDYDIWVCPKAHLRKDAYDGSYAYQYTDCKSCGRHTRKLIRDATVIPATTVSSGSGKKDFLCLNCQKADHETYVIAQISTSSSSSGGGSFGGSSSSGSFGGGSSGGGGAGSSY